MTDLMRLSATEQAALVKQREVTPLELVNASIERIEAVNPKINAVVTAMFDLARDSAGKADLAAPFGGVPFLLKDMLAEYAGTPMSEGSRFLDGYISPHDTELVARYRKAGFIVVGKTNTPEFASKPTTEPALWGPTRNPWDITRSPGGSSGGAAAAVAVGMTAAAHANDGGGSIRCPASWCGVVGLKPTRGRNPLGPDYGEMGSGLICEHVVTRTVLDSAAILDATAGADPGAPYYAPPPTRPFADAVRSDPGRLRIALSTRPIMGTAVHPDCVAAVEATARLCEELGHEVEEAVPEVSTEQFHDIFTTIWISTVAWSIRDWWRRTGRAPAEEFFEPHTWKMYVQGERRSASDLLLAVQDMHRIARQVAPFFDRYDLWLTPTQPQPPVPLGYFDHDKVEPRRATERLMDIARFTSIANVTGQPAISLPLTWTAEGLPIGSQFIGRYGDEATLFGLAGQLEEARPWHDRWPTF